MKKRTTTFILAAAAGSLAFSGVAQGATIDSLFNLGQVNTASDDNVERLIDSESALDIDERLAGPNQVDIGDVLEGIAEFNTLEPPNPGDNLGKGSFYNEFTAHFRIRVHGKSLANAGDDGTPGTEDDQFNFSFQPDFGSSFEGGDGTMIKFYEDDNGGDPTGPGTYGPDPDPSTDPVSFANGPANDISTATDGELFWEAGFLGDVVDGGTSAGTPTDNDGDEVTDQDEFWRGIAADQPAELPDNSNASAANFNIRFNRVTAAGTHGSYPLAKFFGPDPDGDGVVEGVDFTANTQVTTPPEGVGEGWEVGSETELSFSPVPTPSATLASLLMISTLGTMQGLRRRRSA